MSEQLVIETLERIAAGWHSVSRYLSIANPKVGQAVDQQGWTLSIAPAEVRLFEPGNLLFVPTDVEIELHYTPRLLFITHYQSEPRIRLTLELGPNSPAANLADLFPMIASAVKRKRPSALRHGLSLCKAILNVTLEQIRYPTPATKGKAARRVETFYALERFIVGNLSRPVSVRDASESLSMSGRYLNQISNDFRSLTFSEYLNLRRLERARRLLLADPPPKIADLALACGYNGAGYFVRSFRELYGVPPEKLRKELKRRGAHRNHDLHKVVGFEVLNRVTSSEWGSESEDLPQVTLIIINTTAKPADVYWLSPEGVMKPEGELAAHGRWIMGVSWNNVITVHRAGSEELIYQTGNKNCQILL